MKSFKPALYDGSDPLYAPGLSWSKNTASWKVPATYSKAGYRITGEDGKDRVSINLKLPGCPTDTHQIDRARLCRQHTRDMLDWWNDQDASQWDLESWSYVIHRFQTDPESDYPAQEGSTKRDYDYRCRYWDAVIGKAKVGAMDMFEIKRIHKTMKENGRSVSFIHRMVTMLRMLAKYAFLIKVPGGRDVKETLSEMRFQSPAKKQTRPPTRAEIEAVVKEADKHGDHAFAAGLLLQFEFTLRAVNVRGEWSKISQEEYERGGITRQTTYRNKVIRKRWSKGLMLEQFSADMLQFEILITKSARSLPKPSLFTLEHLPELQQRLVGVRGERRMGPLIVSERYGEPYESTAWAALWRRHAGSVGIPAEIQLMDVRSGGLTEAEQAGADPRMLQAAAKHTDFKTTERYLRNTDRQTAEVVALRQKGRR